MTGADLQAAGLIVSSVGIMIGVATKVMAWSVRNVIDSKYREYSGRIDTIINTAAEIKESTRAMRADVTSLFVRVKDLEAVDEKLAEHCILLGEGLRVLSTSAGQEDAAFVVALEKSITTIAQKCRDKNAIMIGMIDDDL